MKRKRKTAHTGKTERHWKKLLAKASDAEVLSLIDKFKELELKLPEVYKFLQPELDVRIAKARQSS